MLSSPDLARGSTFDVPTASPSAASAACCARWAGEVALRHPIEQRQQERRHAQPRDEERHEDEQDALGSRPETQAREDVGGHDVADRAGGQRKDRQEWRGPASQVLTWVRLGEPGQIALDRAVVTQVAGLLVDPRLGARDVRREPIAVGRWDQDVGPSIDEDDGDADVP